MVTVTLSVHALGALRCDKSHVSWPSVYFSAPATYEVLLKTNIKNQVRTLNCTSQHETGKTTTIELGTNRRNAKVETANKIRIEKAEPFHTTPAAFSFTIHKNRKVRLKDECHTLQCIYRACTTNSSLVMYITMHRDSHIQNQREISPIR